MLRVAPRRARSASSVAPFASQSSIARFSSASASRAAPAARSATASAWRASAWSSRSSVAAAISTAARANSIAAACSPRAASASARTPRQAIAALKESPASDSLSTTDRLGLGDPALGEQRAAEQGGGLRGVDAEPLLAEPVVGDAQAALGGGGVSLEQLDQPGEQIGLEHALRDAELFDHAPRRRDHAPRRLGASAQRLEHGLAAQRDGFDRGRPLRDAQHAHDVEAAAARARDRARSPERGDRRAGQHGIGAAAIARAPRGGERLVERRLAGADLAELGEHQRVHGVRLRLARGVTGGRQRGGCGFHRLGAGAQRLRIGEHGELAAEAGVPRAQAIRIGGEAAELGDRAHRGADVAGREQRLAPVEREVGARGIGRVEPRERALQKTRRGRQVVARERPPARGRQMARGPLAEGAALRVDRAELAQMLVGLLEVPAERLVVLDGSRGARLQPVGEARRAAPPGCS